MQSETALNSIINVTVEKAESPIEKGTGAESSTGVGRLKTPEVPSPSARQGYYMIHRFMTEDLRLGGSRLLVYALIYSFTAAEGSFFGSRGYIARACGIVISTVSKVLSELVEEGLLERLDMSCFGTVSYRAIAPRSEMGDKEERVAENRNVDNRTTEKQNTPIRNSDTPPPKNGHNIKEYNKTINQTNNHAMIKVTRARGEEERNGEKSRSATGEYGEAVIVLRGDRSEREKRAELLKERIESGKFRGEIRVPDDVFLEEDLLRRKKGIVRSAYNKEFYLGDTLVPHGTTGKVFLSGSQYDFLRLTYGEELTEEYIRRLEEAMIAKPLFRSFSHFKTIIKWLAEDMQCGDPYEIGKER